MGKKKSSKAMAPILNPMLADTDSDGDLAPESVSSTRASGSNRLLVTTNEASIDDDEVDALFDEKVDEKEDEYTIKGRSLMVFMEDSKLRAFLFDWLLCNKWFDFVVVVLVLVSFALQVWQMPATVDSLSDEDVANILLLDDTVLVIFTIEAVGKIVALGIAGGEASYLRNGWNQVDFIVLLCSWLDVLVGSGMPFVRLTRATRIMRPLRHNPLVEGLVSTAVFYPYILNVCMFLVFFMTIFGTIGMQLFGGVLSYQCAVIPDCLGLGPNGTDAPQSVILSGDALTADVCQNHGAFPHDFRPWYHADGTMSAYMNESFVTATLVRCPPALNCVGSHGNPLRHPHDVACVNVVTHGSGRVKQGPVHFPYPDERIHQTEIYGFDNMMSAFITQFVVTTMDEWPAISHPMIEAGGKHDGLVYIFFVCLILLLGMVIANLFVSVICFGFGNVDKTRETRSGQASVRKSRALFDRFVSKSDEFWYKKREIVYQKRGILYQNDELCRMRTGTGRFKLMR